MRKIFWIVIGVLAILCFDQFMKADAERLCSNDVTAYTECK